MYHMNDKIRSSDLFGTTILEFVKLIQAALSLFGMFSLCQDGLLCDLTVDGIQRWVTEIGELHMGVEVLSLSRHSYHPFLIHTANGENSRSHSSMRSSYPSVQRPYQAVWARVWQCVFPFPSSRFGLSSTAQLIPKDPFLDPQSFLRAVYAFQDPSSSFSTTFLADDILNAIDTAYSKSRTTEPYKVHRVLLNKLDDLATDLRTSSGPKNINLTDIDQFAYFTETKAVKDGVPSLKYLWSGRAEVLAAKRKEWLWSDGEEDNGRDREGKEKSEKTDELSAGDEIDLSRAWSGKRVQRKIESWAGWAISSF
jgi:hypothetical protein